jgi:ferric-dicitrate binding protein FerR (iron transport regulator)
MNEEQLARWMVQEVDGTLPPAEREAFFRHLAEHPDLMRELEEHRAVAAVASGWMRRLEMDLRRTPPGGSGQALGVALVVVSFALGAGGLMWTLAHDPEAPPWLVAALGMNLAGFLVLGWVAWRGRVRDAYDEVQR